MNVLREQSKLLVKLVPFLEPYKCFAFHGGTVINLFCSETFKRYSIDLDGVFIPDKTIDITSNAEVLNSINLKLSSLKKDLLAHKKDLNITYIEQYSIRPTLLIKRENPLDKNDFVSVKIEVHKKSIGSIEQLERRRLTKFFREDFKTDCTILSVSDNQLYGSKIGALFGRNTIKDSYDLFQFLLEGKDLVQYKDGAIYSFLSNPTDIIKILNMDYNQKPDKLEYQIDNLGGQPYSLGKHIFTRKRVKDLILGGLNRQDIHYILASSMRILDKTDYPYKNMRAVILQNKENKKYRKNHPVNYEKNLKNFINTFPFENQKTMMKKELKKLKKISINSSTGLNL